MLNLNKNQNAFEFPKDYFIPFTSNSQNEDEGKEQYLEGRLTINRHEDQFSVEIDIVQKESRKIYAHVGLLTNQPSENEAVEAGFFQLKKFLKLVPEFN